MPRPKVKPEDRQRVAQACIPCKQSKIRCDASKPCANCRRRNRDDSCIYPDADSEKRTAFRRQSHASSTNAGRDLAPAQTSRVQNATSTSPNRSPASDTASRSNSISAQSDQTTELTEPRSRSLLSSKLQKVYVGETANLSYLQFLRKIVRHGVGRCAFTESPFLKYMFESDVRSDGADVLDFVPQVERQSLAQSFLNASSGILYLYTPDEIFASLADAFAPDNALEAVAVYLILGIGAQVRHRDPTDLDVAASLFQRGRCLAFEGFLCDPSPDMVRHFLLMAFYMLGACHRNAAFMYIGIAAKAASALGIHTIDQYRGLSSRERSIRLRAWRSLRALDTIVNSLLGRWGGVASTPHSDARLLRLCANTHDGGGASEMAMRASFDLCPLMDELARAGSNKDIGFAKDFLQRLQKWSKSLPDQLRQSTEMPIDTTASDDRTLFIGGTHVGCVYYFAVALATRRSLTLFLLPQLKRRPSSGTSPQQTMPEAEAENSNMALVCLDAALNIARIGHNALALGQLMSNMCIMQAWMFAAGLILGFAIFVRGTGSDKDMDEAFHQTRAVLKHIGLCSQQALHYYDLLSSFSEAIELYERRRSESTRQLTSRYIDQIFTPNSHTKTWDNALLGSSVGSQGSSGLPVTEPGSLGGGADGAMDLDSLLENDGLNDLFDLTSTQALAGISDTFAADDWQPFAPFFDNLV